MQCACPPDPEAADLVFGHEANIRVVGLDVTHACQFTADDLQGLAGQGRFGTFLQPNHALLPAVPQVTHAVVLSQALYCLQRLVCCTALP